MMLKQAVEELRNLLDGSDAFPKNRVHWNLSDDGPIIEITADDGQKFQLTVRRLSARKAVT